MSSFGSKSLVVFIGVTAHSIADNVEKICSIMKIELPFMSLKYNTSMELSNEFCSSEFPFQIGVVFSVDSNEANTHAIRNCFSVMRELCPGCSFITTMLYNQCQSSFECMKGLYQLSTLIKHSEMCVIRCLEEPWTLINDICGKSTELPDDLVTFGNLVVIAADIIVLYANVNGDSQTLWPIEFVDCDHRIFDMRSSFPREVLKKLKSTPKLNSAIRTEKPEKSTKSRSDLFIENCRGLSHNLKALADWFPFEKNENVCVHATLVDLKLSPSGTVRVCELWYKQLDKSYMAATLSWALPSVKFPTLRDSVNSEVQFSKLQVETGNSNPSSVKKFTILPEFISKSSLQLKCREFRDLYSNMINRNPPAESDSNSMVSRNTPVYVSACCFESEFGYRILQKMCEVSALALSSDIYCARREEDRILRLALPGIISEFLLICNRKLNEN